jgi:hypothetical protein
MKWVCNNFIQVGLVTDLTYGPLLDFDMPNVFARCPYLEHQKINRRLIDSSASILELIEKCLSQKMYLYFDVDTYFLRPFYSNGKSHSIHNIFIYGFNEGMIYFADNLKNERYMESSIEVEKIIDGYMNVENVEQLHAEHIDIVFYKDNNKYEVRLDLIKKGVSDYLSTTEVWDIRNSPHEFWKADWVYGMNHYSIINGYLDKCIDAKADYIDVRAFHLIYEHKKIMRLRVNYLRDKGLCYIDKSLCSMLSELENNALILRNIILKYNLSKLLRLIDNAKIALFALKGKDIAFSEALFKSL